MSNLFQRIRQNKLRDLAKEYHDRCDAFWDEMCKKDGTPIPTISKSIYKISLHNERVRDDVLKKAIALKFTEQELQQAITEESDRRHP